MIHAPVPPDAWAAEGARTAEALDQVAAALVIGRDPEIAALVALAIAGGQRGERRVAIADLVGGLAALGESANAGTPALGLLDCIRDGLPISEIARPLSKDERIFILPSGGLGIGDRLVLESARWPRLVAGFREVDALLLIVVAVDLPPVLSRTFPLLAIIDRPEPELLPVGPLHERPPMPAPSWTRRRRSRIVRTLTVIALLGAGGWGSVALRGRAREASRRATIAAAAPAAAMATAATAAAALADSVGRMPDSALTDPHESTADTITLGTVVNPADSTNATGFTVELVAANTHTGANSGLVVRGIALPAPTLTAVLLGADGRPWYRALTGAWLLRAEADSFLAMLRDRGLVRIEMGRVLRAPYALQLVERMPPEQRTAAIAQWAGRGISAYALLQDDGHASLFAGAFETPGQSVLLALSLRDIGVAPVLAFRTGRMF